MAEIIKGDNTVLWGAGALYATGIISGGSIRTTSEQLLVPGSDGEDVAKVYFNVKKEATVQIIVQTTVPALAIGDVVTIKGEADFLVDSCEETFANKDVRKYSFTATKHMEMVVTPP
jgi:hypothetical protein